MTAVRARTLALEAVPILVAAALTAFAAQLSVHAWPVPFTLQTFVVLSGGLLLGARKGAAAQAAYLAAGTAGMPVFAELKFGPPWLFPSGGYLFGFVLVAALVGWAAERWRGWRLALAIFGANLVLLGVGTLWLSVYLGKASWMSGFVPFIPGAVAQSLAAWAVHRAFRRESP